MLTSGFSSDIQGLHSRKKARQARDASGQYHGDAAGIRPAVEPRLASRSTSSSRAASGFSGYAQFLPSGSAVISAPATNIPTITARSNRVQSDRGSVNPSHTE